MNKIKRVWNSPDPRLSQLLNSGVVIFTLPSHPSSYMALTVVDFNNQKYASIIESNIPSDQESSFYLHAYEWALINGLAGALLLASSPSDLRQLNRKGVDTTPVAVLVSLSPRKDTLNDSKEDHPSHSNVNDEQAPPTEDAPSTEQPLSLPVRPSKRSASSSQNP